jgi:bifunctional UDP-N-acetylglucosamine pyrophosphorylase / glucosamine-1-phosphate N-acetyltransferase
VKGIVEAKDATPEQLQLREINTGMYCFKLSVLREYLDRLTPANAQKEYYLTDVIGMMVADGLSVRATVSLDPGVVLGINNRVDLASITEIVRMQIIKRLMTDGVTVVDPSSTYVDFDVQVGMDTVIYPQTTLEKGVKIGEDCVIGPCVRLSQAELGNEVTVLFSNVADSTVGDGCRIGPFAHIRPGCKLGRHVKIGNFVEGKNAVLEDHVSMGHLTYMGDAVVGERTNIGAGTITCNYDGYSKHRTTIGKNVFIGSDTVMVAPVTIGDGALTAAGSTVTEDVPADSLAIARCKQTVKEGWAQKRREQKARDLD